MSNDERSSNVRMTKKLGKTKRSASCCSSFGIRHSDFVIFSLPALAGIAYRRQAFAKLRLLAFGVFLLLRLACLLLRAGTGSATAGENNNQHRDKKERANQFFHTQIRMTTIIAAINAASFLENDHKIKA